MGENVFDQDILIGAFAVSYVLAIDTLIHRDLTLRKFKEALTVANVEIGVIMIIIAMATSWPLNGIRGR